MSDIERLLQLARAYAAAEGVPLSVVSWRVFGDSKKIDVLVAGGDIFSKRRESAVQWFSDNWPAKTKWPAGIPRPAPAESA